MGDIIGNKMNNFRQVELEDSVWRNCFLNKRK